MRPAISRHLKRLLDTGTLHTFKRVFCRLTGALALIALMSTGNTYASDFDKLSFYSENFPPFNYLDENGELQGPSVDVLIQLFSRLHIEKSKQDIAVLPWARSYQFLLTKRGTVLFVVSRTPERESLFKWVGPVTQSRNAMIGKKIKAPLKLAKKDLLQYNIVVVRNDAAGQILLQQFEHTGITTVDVTSAEQAIGMLELNRADLFAYDENVFNWIADKNGVNTQLYDSVYELSESKHYFAFHIDTPDAVIEAFQTALDALKSDGTWENILESHRMSVSE